MELIVISDLHLSVGYNKKTGRYSRNEDFFFDEEFKRFLEYLHKAKSPKKHLIIAASSPEQSRQGIWRSSLAFCLSSKPMTISKQGTDSIKMRFNIQICLQLFI